MRNGPDASAPSLGGRLCGTSPPSITQTTDNNLHIRFISDATNEGSGFKLIFEAHSQGETVITVNCYNMFITQTIKGLDRNTNVCYYMTETSLYFGLKSIEVEVYVRKYFLISRFSESHVFPLLL